MKNIILFLLLYSILISCKENPKDELKQLVMEWHGKEIIFPESAVFIRNLTDTIQEQIPLSDYKILVYIDSTGCTSCKLQLFQWKRFIHLVDSISGHSVPFLFFIHSKDQKEINYLVRRDHFDYPVCFDSQNQLYKLNKFPDGSLFHTFLLDRDNKVKVLGNPLDKSSVKALYLKEITGKEQTESTIITTAEVGNRIIDLGNLPPGEKQKVSFDIKNTGENPLVILDVATTCGCLKPSFSKSPKSPGEIVTLEVEVDKRDAGFFEETLTVKCNIKNKIQLKIKGQIQ